MKKCFTINTLRNTSDFHSYYPLIQDRLFAAVEIFYPEQPEIRAIYAQNVRDLLKTFPFLEIVFHLPFNRTHDLCFIETSDVLIEKFQNIMVFAKDLRVKKLTMHLGYVNVELARDQYIKHILSVLKKLCTFAASLGLALMIENMPSNSELGYAPEEIRTIIEQVGADNLGFIYDTGHAHVSEFPDLSYLDVLGKYLWHCHLNDNHGQKDEHLAFGKGNFDFSSFFKKTINLGYQGLYCLEILFNDANDLRSYANSFDAIAKTLILQ